MEGRRYSPILLVMRENTDSDVGSPYPGAGEGPKGLAVRQLKRYASWVQTVQAVIKLKVIKFLKEYWFRLIFTL